MNEFLFLKGDDKIFKGTEEGEEKVGTFSAARQYVPPGELA